MVLKILRISPQMVLTLFPLGFLGVPGPGGGGASKAPPP